MEHQETDKNTGEYLETGAPRNMKEPRRNTQDKSLDNSSPTKTRMDRQMVPLRAAAQLEKEFLLSHLLSFIHGYIYVSH